MEAVRQSVDYFNNGDVKAMAATCAVPASILDGSHHRMAGADGLRAVVPRRVGRR